MGTRTWARGAFAAVVIAATATACTATPPHNSGDGGIGGGDEPTIPAGDDEVRLNELQFIGSHNSYHVAPEAPVLGWLSFLSNAVPDIASALGDPEQLNYTHAPLTTQLQRGIRSFELDVAADPTGGTFSRPLIIELLNLPVQRPTGLSEPGMKVLHIQDIDWRSTCPTLIGCLGELKAWSDDHRDHLPMIINLELKEDRLPAPFDATVITPFDATQLDALDAEIRSVLGDRLITPDDVRGDAADLRTAVTTDGWPTVAASRGRFLFFLDNTGVRDRYLDGHPSLEGRVLFTSSGEGQPDGAVLKENEPGDGTRLRSLVEQGYLVRTRADADVVSPSAAQRDTALASGAQIVHTDFPPGESARTSGYVVTFGTRVAARCNPVLTTPERCAPAVAVEAP
ncbi:MAG: Ca2+-dependent phosphoinositide-specific phospholipase C [Microthrixaceae bacterium]